MMMETSDLEGSLGEDVDEFSGRFSGMLSFDDAENGMIRDPSSHSLGLPFDESGRPIKQSSGHAHFEVVNAKIVKEPRSKYVIYSVLAVGSAGLDSCPVTVDKRYSDFDYLNTTLRKKFLPQMENISFPKKLITGNFKPETIAQRSRAFEQYLSHLFFIDSIRLSAEFCAFFYGEDIDTAYACIHNGQYREAIPLLQRVANIEKKLLGVEHHNVIATLCALVVCYQEIERNQQGQTVAEAALRCIGNDEQNRYLIPLLQLSIRLCWKLGKDKKDLEAQLQQLRAKGHPVHAAPSLLELVVRRFQNK